jgi:hypothetical protein
MQFAEWLSLIALVISIGSLAASLYFNLRDRAKVEAKSKYYPGFEDGVPMIEMSVVNAGRRPVVLRMWGGTDSSGDWAGTMINSNEGGKRLAEHERYEVKLTRGDLIAFTPDDDVVFVDLWFEDTLGRRHRVLNARDHARKLWNCSAT